MINKRILVSLMVIGVVGAVAGSATFAEFTDTESSTDNTFTAGTLDLQLDWEQTYNGPAEYNDAVNQTEPTNCQMQETEVEDGQEQVVEEFVNCQMFSLSDVKPGDSGEATVSLHLDDNPGYIWTRFDVYNDYDNECNEPEADVDSSCTDNVDGDGELAENTRIVMWTDDADNNGDGLEAGNNQYDDGERVLYNGTAADLDEEEVMLDADSSTTETNEAFPSGTSYVAIKWDLPYETGNIVQSDSFMMDVDYAVQQERHTGDNGGPQSPFNTPS